MHDTCRADRDGAALVVRLHLFYGENILLTLILSIAARALYSDLHRTRPTKDASFFLEGGQSNSLTNARTRIVMHERESPRNHWKQATLKFSVARRAWKRDHVADVAHPRHELHCALQTQTESRVGNGAEAA